LAPRFFGINELRDARVYDSEALFYGVLDGLVFREGTVFLKLAIEVKARQPVVDVERLRRRLVESGAKLGGEEPVEYLVARAREEGLDIPYRVAEKPVRLTKALVPVKEVAIADSKKLWRGMESREERVIVLRTPREARYRGREIRVEMPAVPEPSELRGKLVVSLSDGILGYAEEIVIGPGEPGIRVSHGQGVAGYINWIAFLNTLKKRGLIDLYEKLAEHYDPLASPRLDITMLPSIERLLKSLGAPSHAKQLLHEHVMSEPLRGSYTDIPWSNVLKIGDIVITK
jgi:hypothetical protein